MPHVLDNIQEVMAIPEAPKEDFMFVDVPEVDIYDAPYPTIQLNSHKFEPGHRYKVPVEVGLEIENRKKLFEKECIRLLRPKADGRSVDQVNRGSSWTRKGGNNVTSGEAVDASFGPNDKVIEVRW